MVIDNIALKKLCRIIKNDSNGIIGIDTEFIRKSTYYPLLCTIQIIYFSKTQNKNIKEIIDVLAPNIDLKPFFNILKDKNIKKVFHSCSQDLEALYRNEKIKIKNIEDIQVMAEFCGYKYNMSYSDIVNEVLKIDFRKNKNIQKSNWKKRPLSKKQLEYALDDIEYIIYIYKELLKQLEEYNNYEYYISEMKYLLKFKGHKYIFKDLWKKVKFMINKKSINYIMLLEELLIWREKKAIENDVIRNRILSDNSVKNIVNYKPKNYIEMKQLFANNNDILNLKKTYKKEILDIINLFLSKNNSKYKSIKKIFYVNELKSDNKKIFDNLFNKICLLAKEQHINICRLLTKNDIINLLMNYEKKKDILYGWKWDLLSGLIDFKNKND